MSTILLISAYKIFMVKIKRRIIPSIPYFDRFGIVEPLHCAKAHMFRSRAGAADYFVNAIVLIVLSERSTITFSPLQVVATTPSWFE
jgi:hypothetical protein